MISLNRVVGKGNLAQKETPLLSSTDDDESAAFAYDQLIRTESDFVVREIAIRSIVCPFLKGRGYKVTHFTQIPAKVLEGKQTQFVNATDKSGVRRYLFVSISLPITCGGKRFSHSDNNNNNLKTFSKTSIWKSAACPAVLVT